MDNIIDCVIAKLKDEDVWFTTKLDPVFEEPNSYYELDEYGDLTDKSKKQIEKEVSSYIGDGAVDIKDAVDAWFDETLWTYKLNYKDNLITKFKPKQVIPGLDAYENSVQLAEAYHPDIDLNNIKMGICPYCGSKKLRYDNNKQCTVDEYNDYVSYAWQCEECKNEGNEVFTMEFLGQEIYNDPDDDSSGTSLLTKTESKEVKTESVKTRLREENTKSLNLISQKLQDENFDAESNEGKIVTKTSELFNMLSDLGYDVQVSFDNGESQSKILLGQQGGAVIITITNGEQPLKAYTTGNFELSKDNIEVLQTISNKIKDTPTKEI